MYSVHMYSVCAQHPCMRWWVIHIDLWLHLVWIVIFNPSRGMYISNITCHLHSLATPSICKWPRPWWRPWWDTDIREKECPLTFVHYTCTVFAVRNRNVGCVWPRNTNGLGTKTTSPPALVTRAHFMLIEIALQRWTSQPDHLDLGSFT